MHPLLFDIDGTLIASGGAGRHAIAAAFAAAFGLAAPLEGIPIDGRTDRAIFSDAIARTGVSPDQATIERMITAYLARLPEALHGHDGRILDGVVDLLDALDQAGAALGLATGNVARGAELKLRHFGLWERFRAGGFGDASVDRAEVVATAIEALSREAGLNGASVSPIVIGDTPHDVAAAHTVGAYALTVATGAYDEDTLRESGADFVLPDLRDTEAALAILLG